MKPLGGGRGAIRRITVGALIAAGAVAAGVPAFAQTSSKASGQAYPTKYVRIITGGVGGMGDIAARQLGQRLGERWGQAVVVENRPGGGNTIATGLVVRSTPRRLYAFDV